MACAADFCGLASSAFADCGVAGIDGAGEDETCAAFGFYVGCVYAYGNQPFSFVRMLMPFAQPFATAE